MQAARADRPPAVGHPTAQERHGGRLKRALLAASMAVVGLNVWTGSPLFALWVASRVQGSGPPKMETFLVFGLLLVTLSFVLIKLLALLGRAYDATTGQEPTVRTHAPWLRSMGGERPQYPGEHPRLTALERILVVMVLIVALVFEVWFFFFSPSPIDERSGRAEAPARIVTTGVGAGEAPAAATLSPRPPRG